jgi:hypothetical protein
LDEASRYDRNRDKTFRRLWVKSAHRIPNGKFPIIKRFLAQENDATTPMTETVVNSLTTSPDEGQRFEQGQAVDVTGIVGRRLWHGPCRGPLLAANSRAGLEPKGPSQNRGFISAASHDAEELRSLRRPPFLIQIAQHFQPRQFPIAHQPNRHLDTPRKTPGECHLYFAEGCVISILRLKKRVYSRL